MRNLKTVILFSFVGTACAAHRYAVTYEFPDMMKEPVRSEYRKMWEKGADPI